MELASCFSWAGSRCWRWLVRLIVGIALALAAACLASAETHVVIAAKYYNAFSHAYPPLVRVRSGDTIRTKTLDSRGFTDKGIQVARSGNALTGPFYVQGAEPGDALEIHFNQLSLNRNWGYSNWRLGLYALAPESVEGIYSDKTKPNVVRPGTNDQVHWDIDLGHHTVRLRSQDLKSAAIPFQFPTHPMLGCVGVAPGGDIVSGGAGAFGGNMDFNMMAEGATLILPVFHEGGLLFLGDGHALMGDGEALGDAVETSMDVEFTVAIRKQAKLTEPRLETAEYLVAIGAQTDFESSLNRGLQLATSDMVRWLTEDYHLEPWAAHVLIGMQAQYRVITVGGSIALLIPKGVLPQPAKKGS
jgi:acetamidase/formamidase